MNRVTTLITLAIFAAKLFFTANLAAKDPRTSQLKLKNDRVIVFKDGYAMVVKQGAATTDQDGMVYIDEVPDAAILGSFWAIPDRGKIKSMVAGWKESESKTDRELNCTNMVEIIKANLGKQCQLVTSKNLKLEGQLLKILSNDEQAEMPQIDPLSSLRAPTTAVVREQEFVTPITGEWFILRTDEGDMMLATSAIKHLTMDGMTSTITRTTTKRVRKKQLSLKFAEPNQDIKIHLMYFRPGIRWIPTYRINLTDKRYQSAGKTNAEANGTTSTPPDAKYKTAEIFMQGELINEAEDLVDVPFHVVVGVPNFRFRSVTSPLVLEKKLRGALAQAVPNLANRNLLFNNQISNAMFTQRSGQQPSQGTSATEQAVDFSQEIATSSGNDLFVYELENMTLKKGERAMSPIIRTDAAYRDVYTWDVVIPRAATATASTSPLVLSENTVWRQIELINNTKIPWTTGAAMFTNGFLPLAQELLTYTSPGGACRVPVTVAVDLRGTAEDSETGRKFDAFTWRSYRYAKVKGQAGLTLTNRKQESVDVEISLRFGGKATDASDDGAIKLEAYRSDDWRQNGDTINNSSLIKWTTRLEPQKSFQPVTQYEYFIRY